MGEKMGIEKIERVNRADRKVEGEGEELLERVAPDKDQFQALMAEESGKLSPNEASDLSLKKAALMEEVREVGGRLDLIKKKTPEEIIEQTRDVIAKVDEIKQKLQTPNLRFDVATQQVMESKLLHIDDKLRVALEKAGAEYTPLEVRTARHSLRNPIERFLGFLENGESHLKQIASSVQLMGEDRKSITPARLLAVQIKVGFVQNELEFFSNVLNKALESTKTLMNVQV